MSADGEVDQMGQSGGRWSSRVVTGRRLAPGTSAGTERGMCCLSLARHQRCRWEPYVGLRDSKGRSAL